MAELMGFQWLWLWLWVLGSGSGVVSMDINGQHLAAAEKATREVRSMRHGFGVSGLMVWGCVEMFQMLRPCTDTGSAWQQQRWQHTR